ncbi:LysR family transcriptional regulator [Rhodococcus sp. MTM3W5.2]|uniref:LysR family transcriptional regulator n=1 Tax=Rhodococcus sp. MTM3W5.2 TaxID=1805827 RepID=UPI00097BEBEB|nr:LysR substrate-binding domain-containing protein [Rhodococcus sp. MTM3W5.2]
MELQTRQLRYFVAVAEELSFTRAAQRLHIAQQALSAQIKQLEQSLGVVLLTRTTRSVTLTAAGAAFLEDTSALLAALDDAVERALSMEHGENQRLVLGFTEGAALILTEPIMSAFRDRHPGVTIEMRQFNYDDPSGGLNDRSVDVAFVRRPLTTEGIDFETLFREPRMAMMRADHPLAARASVTVADLIDEPIFGAATTDAAWNAYWELDDHRGGKPGRVVSRSTTLLEEFQKVAAGVGIVVTVACARWIPYPGVTLVPIADDQPSEVAAAWQGDSDSTLVRSFIDAAIRVRDARPDLVKRLEDPDLTERTMPTLIPY